MHPVHQKSCFLSSTENALAVTPFCNLVLNNFKQLLYDKSEDDFKIFYADIINNLAKMIKEFKGKKTLYPTGITLKGIHLNRPELLTIAHSIDKTITQHLLEKSDLKIQIKRHFDHLFGQILSDSKTVNNYIAKYITYLQGLTDLFKSKSTIIATSKSIVNYNPTEEKELIESITIRNKNILEFLETILSCLNSTEESRKFLKF